MIPSPTPRNVALRICGFPFFLPVCGVIIGYRAAEGDTSISRVGFSAKARREPVANRKAESDSLGDLDPGGEKRPSWWLPSSQKTSGVFFCMLHCFSGIFLFCSDVVAFSKKIVVFHEFSLVSKKKSYETTSWKGCSQHKLTQIFVFSTTAPNLDFAFISDK